MFFYYVFKTSQYSSYLKLQIYGIISPFIQQILLSTYCTPHTIIGTWNMQVNKIDINPVLMSILCFRDPWQLLAYSRCLRSACGIHYWIRIWIWDSSDLKSRNSSSLPVAGSFVILLHGTENLPHKGTQGLGHHQLREFIHPSISLFIYLVSKHTLDKHAARLELVQGHSCVFKVTGPGADLVWVTHLSFFFNVFLSQGLVSLKMHREGGTLVVSEAKHQHEDTIRSSIYSGNTHWTLTLPGPAPGEVKLHEMLFFPPRGSSQPKLGDTERPEFWVQVGTTS